MTDEEAARLVSWGQGIKGAYYASDWQCRCGRNEPEHARYCVGYTANRDLPANKQPLYTSNKIGAVTIHCPHCGQWFWYHIITEHVNWLLPKCDNWPKAGGENNEKSQGLF